MQSKRSFLPTFLLFFLFSGLIFFLSSKHVLPGENFFQNMLFPVEGSVFSLVHTPFNFFSNQTLQQLQQENQQLTAQLVHMQQVQEDNTALRDQFQTTAISTSSLIPAAVIGDPQFIPGVSSPESLVLDKGKDEGISSGDSVVYKDNVVGSVTTVADHASSIMLVSSSDVSFTAKTSSTHAQGVLSGQGGGVMILGNVDLADILKVGDIVTTNGSEDVHGKGFPPGLVVGKIVSVQKTPSNLYQSARVQSLLAFNRLTTVFIMK